jgi:outer membrane protein
VQEKRLLRVSLIAMLFLVGLRARDAAGEEIQQPVAPAAQVGEPIPLPLLVRDALRDNLTLRSVRASTLSVETSVEAESSRFDPLFQISPFYSRSELERLDAQSGAIVAGARPNGGVASSFGGILPSSTSYSIGLASDWQRQTNPAFQPGFPSPSVNSALSFSLAQPLMRGRGRSIVQGPVDLARTASQSARARLDRVVEETITNVENAYWSLGLAEAAERIARDSLKRARDLLARNVQMRELKLISEVDTITSRRGVQERLTSLTDAVRRREDAFERLIFLVYGEGASERLRRNPIFHTEPPPTDYPELVAMAGIEEQALQERRDLEGARLDLAQSEISKRLAKNALKPDVRLTAGYLVQTQGTDSFRLLSTSRPGDVKESDWQVGISLSYPFGNRASKAADARARYENDVQRTLLASSQAAVRSEVRAAARAIEANRERLAQAQLSFTYARQQYDAGQEQLRLGLIDSFRLLQMEDDVSNAESVLEQTRYDLAFAASIFRLAMGTNDEPYRSVVANP